MVDNRNPVAELLGLFKIMRGQHDCNPAFVQFQHIVPKLLAKLDIDASGRLIQNNDRRRMHHRLCHQQPPLHAARQGARVSVGLVLQPHRAQQLHRPPLGFGDAVKPGLQLQRFFRREERIEHNLLRHNAD